MHLAEGVKVLLLARVNKVNALQFRLECVHELSELGLGGLQLVTSFLLVFGRDLLVCDSVLENNSNLLRHQRQLHLQFVELVEFLLLPRLTSEDQASAYESLALSSATIVRRLTSYCRSSRRYQLQQQLASMQPTIYLAT